jgi:hypothetical protein
MFFSKICRENNILIKIYQEKRVIYLKTYIKAIPLQALTGSEVSSRLRLPDFKTIGT